MTGCLALGEQKMNGMRRFSGWRHAQRRHCSVKPLGTDIAQSSRSAPDFAQLSGGAGSARWRWKMSWRVPLVLGLDSRACGSGQWLGSSWSTSIGLWCL